MCGVGHFRSLSLQWQLRAAWNMRGDKARLAASGIHSCRKLLGDAIEQIEHHDASSSE